MSERVPETAMELGALRAFPNVSGNGMDTLTWLTGQALLGMSQDTSIAANILGRSAVDAAVNALQAIMERKNKARIEAELDAEGM